MRIAVLASPTSWYLHDLQRAATGAQSVAAFPFSRVGSRIDDTVEVRAGDQPLSEFDAVLVRTMPPGSLEQVVFRMDALQQLVEQGTAVVNPPKAIEAAVDKYLTLCRLRAAGFDVPRTETDQTLDDAMASFSRLGGDVVVKPLFGSEGRGITRITDEAIAERSFRLLTQLGAVIYQQEFIPHKGFDIRLLVLGDQVLGMRRSNQLDWRTNVSRGADAEAMDVAPQLTSLARQASQAVGTLMAGVDVLPARDGRQLLLEVNAVPGWRALARASHRDIAQQVLQTIERFVEHRYS